MLIEKKVRQVEPILEFKPKQTRKRTELFERQSKAKTFKSWIEASTKLSNEEHKYCKTTKMFTPDDFSIFLESIKNKYKELSIERVELEKQQGKSSFDVEYGKDIIEVITYRNNSQTTTKIRMIEKMWVQNYLLKKLEEEEQLDSIPNALVFARTFDYNLRTKENYYSDRFFQNYWCIMLDLLRKEGIIEYCAGVIRKNE